MALFDVVGGGETGTGLEGFPVFTPTSATPTTFVTDRIAKTIIVAVQFSSVNGGCIFYILDVDSNTYKIYYYSDFDLPYTPVGTLNMSYDKNTRTFSYTPMDRASYFVPTKVMWR